MPVTTKSVAAGVEISDGKNTVVVPRDQVSTVIPEIQMKADSLATARSALDAALNNPKSSDLELIEAFNRYMKAFALKP